MWNVTAKVIPVITGRLEPVITGRLEPVITGATGTGNNRGDWNR
jgi:hypothetical protein